MLVTQLAIEYRV